MQIPPEQRWRHFSRRGSAPKRNAAKERKKRKKAIIWSGAASERESRTDSLSGVSPVQTVVEGRGLLAPILELLQLLELLELLFSDLQHLSPVFFVLAILDPFDL